MIDPLLNVVSGNVDVSGPDHSVNIDQGDTVPWELYSETRSLEVMCG